MIENNTAWYKTWFDTPFYHTLYEDRNLSEAQFFLQNLIQHLPIKPQDCILDIACGRGRHALYLAAEGFRVTGIDLSPNSILYAQQEAKKRALDATFYVHDMRETTQEKVDVLLNIFTSIGYFEDVNDNTKALQAFYNSLVKGGIAVIDFLYVPWVQKHWIADEIVTKGNITFTLNRRILDGMIVKQNSISHDIKPYTFRERVRALTLSDFEQMCKTVGLRIAEIFGDYALNPFDTKTAKRLILVLQK